MTPEADRRKIDGTSGLAHWRRPCNGDDFDIGEPGATALLVLRMESCLFRQPSIAQRLDRFKDGLIVDLFRQPPIPFDLGVEFGTLFTHQAPLYGNNAQSSIRPAFAAFVVELMTFRVRCWCATLSRLAQRIKARMS